MSNNIELYVSCHMANVHIPDNALLRPIQVGCAVSGEHFDGMLHDDEGENISNKNRSYCELTGQYWAWKHSNADYLGFLHYRRYFNFSDETYPIHHEPFIFGDVVFDRNDDDSLARIGFDEARIREVVTKYDFIAPTPIATPDGVNVYEQYRLSAGHHIEDFDCALDIIERRYPEVYESAKKYLAQDKLYVCNMFVMRRELFDAYSSFLFDVLAQHEKLCDTTHYTAVARRVSGYLGERICGIYLAYLYDAGYKGCDLQRVYFRDATDGAHAASSQVTRPVCSIAFGDLTRGEGKIFLRLEDFGVASCSDELAHIVAESTTTDGKPVPAKVLYYDDAFVVVLKVLDVDQELTVTLVDDSGSVVARGSRKVGHKSSALESKKNTFMKNEGALAIRNCDKFPLPHDTRLKIVQDIVDVDGGDILHGTITIPLCEGHDRGEFLDVVVVDALGNKINAADWHCMRDEVGKSKDYPSFCVRSIDFSVKIPVCGSYAVWARFPESPTQDCFAVVYGGASEAMRNGWRGLTTPASDEWDYDPWFRERHRATALELDVQRRVAFELCPTFSVIVPLFKTPIAFFREMADSVIGQTYSKWQLVLVNASPDDAELKNAVAEYCARDSRIISVALDENRGITENTNEGIKVATGEFLCFFDHDDVLEPDALYWYVRAYNEHSDIDMFYCDEDKLLDGVYRQPFLKPDWNPDLLLGMNYVCHFLAVRASILDEIGLPGSEYDGSQDWHMTFRIGEKARRIYHEPRVLYHWRVHENSTAASASQKSYTLDSSRLSVETHIQRMGIRGKVVDSPIMSRRFVVEYDLSDKPLVSIIIPNKDAVKVLSRCLTSIRRHTTYENYEIVIVENNSADEETFAYYHEMEQADSRIKVAVLEGMESFNFSRIINFGVEHARGEYLLFLNNDTEVITPGWIEQLLGPCTREDVGATGARLLFADGTVQHAGVTFGFEGPCHLGYLRPRGDLGNMESMQNLRDVSAVTGACLLTKRSDFVAVGGMDEDLSVNYNDVDYCLKLLEKDLRIVWCPTAELYHYESVSRGSEKTGAKALRFRTEKGKFMQRWPEVFEKGDPCSNPNLEPGNVWERIKWSNPVKGWE